MENLLLDLEDQRIKLNNKRKWLKPLLICLAILVFLCAPLLKYLLNFSIHEDTLKTLTTLSLVAMAALYVYTITKPFIALGYKLKETLLGTYLEEFHPEIEYDYVPKPGGIDDVVGGLLNLYHPKEYDGLYMNYKGNEIHISDLQLHTSSKGKKSDRVFSGLFLHIKTKDRNFPRTDIKSDRKVRLEPVIDRDWFSRFKDIENSSLSYLTENEIVFEKEIASLIPFLNHLIKDGDGLRVIFDRNEIFLFLETKMDFLDNPKLKITESLINENYNQNLAKHINSFLFIADTLAQRLNTSDVEEQLELKILSKSPAEIIL